MPRWQITSGVAVLGAVILVVGLCYGVITVGVPYPEPTPSQAAWEKIHSGISGWLMLWGTGTLFLGLIGLMACFVVRNRNQTS